MWQPIVIMQLTVTSIGNLPPMPPYLYKGHVGRLTSCQLR